MSDRDPTFFTVAEFYVNPDVGRRLGLPSLASEGRTLQYFACRPGRDIKLFLTVELTKGNNRFIGFYSLSRFDKLIIPTGHIVIAHINGPVYDAGGRGVFDLYPSSGLIDPHLVVVVELVKQHDVLVFRIENVARL